MGLGAWTPERGEENLSGAKADVGDVILGCSNAEFDVYSALPLVGLRGSCGDIHWVLEWERGLLGKEICLEKDSVDVRFLDCGAPLGRVLMGSLTGLRMKREDLSW